MAGGVILAVNTILMQFLNWMSYGVDGFAYAAESLVGRYTGAGDRPTTRRVVRLSLYWGMALVASMDWQVVLLSPYLANKKQFEQRPYLIFLGLLCSPS